MIKHCHVPIDGDVNMETLKRSGRGSTLRLVELDCCKPREASNISLPIKLVIVPLLLFHHHSSHSSTGVPPTLAIS